MKKKATTRVLIAIICLSISASMLTKLGGGESSFSFQALLQGMDNAQVIDWDIGREIGKYQEWTTSWTRDNGFLEVVAGILNVIVIPVYIIIGIGAGIIQLVIIIVNLIIPQVVSNNTYVERERGRSALENFQGAPTPLSLSIRSSSLRLPNISLSYS